MGEEDGPRVTDKLVELLSVSATQSFLLAHVDRTLRGLSLGMLACARGKGRVRGRTTDLEVGGNVTESKSHFVCEVVG